MASLAHMGVGFAAKRIAPQVPVWILIICAYLIDLIWGVFFAFKIEFLPGPGITTTNPWSHGLFMSLIWSLLAGVITFLLSKNKRTSVIIGLLVFSHWIVDFISRPMLYAFPNDTKLSIFFDGSPTVGLGVWKTQAGVIIGEYGTLVVGLAIYILTLVKIRKEKEN
jgi:hypothetical protein